MLPVIGFLVIDYLQKIVLHGGLPDEWLTANITPLFKKGNKLEPTNYRPVSLTSIVCKIMEKMIKNVMMAHLKVNKTYWQVNNMVLLTGRAVVQIY